MKTQKLYRYMGYNGVITSPVLLPDISHIELYELRAEGGKHLTNGQREVYSVIVDKDAISEWVEVEGIIE